MLPADHAKLYREKATELRLLAAHLTMNGAKKDIEAIATLYERLADIVDELGIRRIRKISN
jgi:hypothetical protein